MGKRFACSTVTFSGELPARLEAIRQAGFAAAEITTRDMFESLRGPAYTAGLIRGSGLDVATYQLLRDFEGGPRETRAARIDIARQVFDQARMIGSGLVILCANTSDDCSGDIDLIAEDLAVLGDVAAEHGVRIGFESLCWATHLADYRDGWAAVRRADHPAVGLMLDSSHIGAIGLPFADIADIPSEKIFLVEIADLPKANLKPIEISLAYRLFPGEGTLDIAEFVRTVEGTGYRGYYSLEVFNAHYRQLDSRVVAERAYKAMAGLWAEAGLAV